VRLKLTECVYTKCLHQPCCYFLSCPAIRNQFTKHCTETSINTIKPIVLPIPFSIEIMVLSRSFLQQGQLPGRQWQMIQMNWILLQGSWKEEDKFPGQQWVRHIQSILRFCYKNVLGPVLGPGFLVWVLGRKHPVSITQHLAPAPSTSPQFLIPSCHQSPVRVSGEI